MIKGKNICIGILFENYKELNDLLQVANDLTKKANVTIKIISPSKLYNDSKSDDLLNNQKEEIDIYYISPHKTKKFQLLSSIEKFFIVLKERKKMIQFFNDVDIVLSGVQIIFERLLYKELKKNNIKFFVYHRHLLFKNNINKKNPVYDIPLFKFFASFLNLDCIVSEIPNIGFADKYLVLGKVNSDYLLSFGVNKEDISVVGSLEYDDIELPLIDTNKKIKKQICYITSAFESIKHFRGEMNEQKKIIELIQYINKNSDEYELTIRIHPRANYEKYEKLQKEYPFVLLEYPNANSIIYDLYKYDLNIGGFSTAMFEIALFNKPILFYCFDEEIEEYSAILKYIPKKNIINNLENGLCINSIDVSNIIYYKSEETSKSRITNLLLKELNA